MTKRKKKKTDVPTPTVSSVPSTGLRRVVIRVSEEDFHALQQTDGAGVQVMAYGSTAKGLTDAQREKRKAYRQRDDVRERQKAYRAERSKRIRAAKAAAKASQAGTV